MGGHNRLKCLDFPKLCLNWGGSAIVGDGGGGGGGGWEFEFNKQQTFYIFVFVQFCPGYGRFCPGCPGKELF